MDRLTVLLTAPPIALLLDNPTPLAYPLHGYVFIPTCGLLLPGSCDSSLKLKPHSNLMSKNDPPLLLEKKPISSHQNCSLNHDFIAEKVRGSLMFSSINWNNWIQHQFSPQIFYYHSHMGIIPHFLTWGYSREQRRRLSEMDGAQQAFWKMFCCVAAACFVHIRTNHSRYYLFPLWSTQWVSEDTSSVWANTAYHSCS